MDLLNRLGKATERMRVQDASPKSYLSIRHENGRSYLRKMTPTSGWPLCEDFGPFRDGQEVVEHAERLYSK